MGIGKAIGSAALGGLTGGVGGIVSGSIWARYTPTLLLPMVLVDAAVSKNNTAVLLDTLTSQSVMFTWV